MQITQQQLLIEAGQLALEVRLKDRTIETQNGQITALATEVAQLRAEVEQLNAERRATPDAAPDGSAAAGVVAEATSASDAAGDPPGE